METQFVVTPWRSRNELLEVRQHLFWSAGDTEEDTREKAVNKIFAWRVRGLELPLLLESTADIVDAILQDENAGLGRNALRLVYATAISRFITGLSDTQAELSRSRPFFFSPTKSLQFPLALRETRHCIVHRHLPSLAELKRAAKESLEWLWEWYWSHLDAAFAERGAELEARLTERDVRERLQGLLKSYVKERKGEIKSRTKETRAASSAVGNYLFVDVPKATKQALLLELLVNEKAILPNDTKLGISMSGAFLIWSPFILALSKSTPPFLRLLLERMISVMSSPLQGPINIQLDPGRDGMYQWCMHILLSIEWQEARHRPLDSTWQGPHSERRLLDYVYEACFTTPTFWTLKLTETLLREQDVAGGEPWRMILRAAKGDDNMQIDKEQAAAPDASTEETHMNDVETMSLAKGEYGPVMKLTGPQKVVGLWRPQPIGVIPKRWEVDE